MEIDKFGTHEKNFPISDKSIGEDRLINENSIVGDVVEQRNLLYKQGVVMAAGLIGKYVNILREKYPDYEDFRLYHALVGSGVGKECSKFDFPGDDSISVFLEKALNGLENKNSNS
jgi:hypothetical protein